MERESCALMVTDADGLYVIMAEAALASVCPLSRYLSETILNVVDIIVKLPDASGDGVVSTEQAIGPNGIYTFKSYSSGGVADFVM